VNAAPTKKSTRRDLDRRIARVIRRLLDGTPDRWAIATYKRTAKEQGKTVLQQVRERERSM
jgi:hypothetical protein